MKMVIFCFTCFTQERIDVNLTGIQLFGNTRYLNQYWDGIDRIHFQQTLNNFIQTISLIIWFSLLCIMATNTMIKLSNDLLEILFELGNY